MSTPPLTPGLSGDRVTLDSRAGTLSVYVAGGGPPLLLVHSVNAAACAAEVRPLHEHYRATRTVYSIDLPGFGFSERSDRAYTPRLMVDAILALRDLVASRHGPAAVDALALSLGCEFLARAALESHGAFRTLALVSPTGFEGRRDRRGPAGATLLKPGLLRALRGPGWGGPLFRALTRPAVIRFFLEKTWGGPAIDEELWRYDVLTTRQPGAEFAPLHFLAGGLFSADAQLVYEQLSLPVWMAHGVRGDFTDYRAKSIVEGKPNWRIDVFQAGALPHFERLPEFVAAYDAFLAGASRAAP
ncbi:MAG TPA: alpha/beta hydrolase [Burkholderiaceae bacterium]|nr:alpha/beta hydrolase [Burkholderiaceae bacterium]